MPDPVTGAVAGGTILTLDSGRRAADASRDAARVQAESGAEAIEFRKEQADRGLEFFDQFQPLVNRSIDSSSFLANPDAQFEFLQSNPLFKMALDEANAGTIASAASSGRLGAGDTGSELARNVFLAASPLIDRQRQDIGNLLNLGTGITTSKANTVQNLSSGVSPIITDIGASNAAGIVGESNARNRTMQNLFGLFGQFAGGGAFGSDLQGVFG